MKLHTAGLLLLFLAAFGLEQAVAQQKPGYANSWINYGKPYVKIGVIKKGLHKITMTSLPKEFSSAAVDKLQLWHRGKQVSIISANSSEIVFFGVPNDGSSDSLLYRPMSSRMNPYFSMYSDESSYFLTIGDTAGLRAKATSEPVNVNAAALPSHDEKVTTVFQTDYSLSTVSPVRPNFFNSFFEIGASRTGKIVLSGVMHNNEFTLKNLVGGVENAKIKLLVHGRSNNDRSIEVYVGKNATSLRLVGTIRNSGFGGSEYTFNIKPGDVDDAKKGVLGLKSITTERSERFSLAYYDVSYPQAFDMTGLTGKEFNLKPAKTGFNRVQVKGLPAKSTLLDISNVDTPVVVNGSGENYMVNGTQGKNVRFYASNEITTVAAAKIKPLNLEVIEPKQPNYIIITTQGLMQGANQYAAYRSSADGGGFKTIILNVADLYDQFNYGEPSPLGIRNFMAYMLGEGGKTDKHLFLIGKSITHNERMTRELPDEVPTIGYPASDVLLVEGLAGTAAEIPAIPVGRLSAISNQNVLDYLTKVKEYEHNAIGDYGWRKNFLHLNGGKNTGEITQLKEFLSDLEPTVANGVVGGKVIPFVKQQPIAEVESVNITAEVNAGAGLITYFGHGSATVTDLDMGYITDVKRGYNNFGKYPMMYFNGCGVGNIFAGRFNPNPNATSDRITLSLDWLLAKDRGSVAIIANSYESFVSPSAQYLEQLYKNMFAVPSTVNFSIGKIQIAVAEAIISKTKDKYAVANIHQSLLQGDPALKLVTVSNPDYAVNSEQSISLYSESGNKTIDQSDSVRVAVVLENKGRFVADQSITVDVAYVGNSTVTKSVVVKSFPARDTIMVSFANRRDLDKITVNIDPKHLVKEMDLSNNLAEMDINWDMVKDMNFFSSANNRDVVPPMLHVRFNGTLPKDNEQLNPNPTINITLRDDRQLFADTDLVEVYLKRCPDSSCEFEKLSYTAAGISVDSLDNYSFRINYPTTGLVAGEYELLVNAKDRAGNFCTQPYQISFRILEAGDAGIKLVASPNPATTFVRFELSDVSVSGPIVIKYSIYSLTGALVEEKEFRDTAGSRKLDWYWNPSSSFAAGLFTYKVVVSGQDGQTLRQLTGKVVVTK
ncbi:putative type IX secretion system sortase PorU2 [Dyadobacter fermentans]|nr:C25 family cysteine peptidase [Dyadobacter fermentans]